MIHGSVINNQKGFTFTEILIALMIMTVGFLAMAQMQYASLRQKQLAETGTIGTNIIQFIADRDLAEVRRIHLMNAIAYGEAQAGRLNTASDTEPHLQHCKGEQTICNSCPCNALLPVTLNPTPQTDGDGNPVAETTCAVLNVHNFDPSDVSFLAGKDDCEAAATDGSMFALKQVLTEVDQVADPDQITLNITYAIKSAEQFDDTAFDNVSVKDTLVVQDFIITAHVENWSETMGPDWTTVNVPHVP